ncbi:RNA polymerase-associated protein CTR9 homolog [Drosophila innubila]|uniref:RNA polymerase-associated protein CTR9 homolog n=1 Tax=Drosophila innubila TaxID=198719 RepID=UPI00148C24CE|nr:RNA polymerase-associated protein CTR9 homolog [Drosophila innubila]
MSNRENLIGSLPVGNRSNNGQQNEEDSTDLMELIEMFAKRRVKLNEWIEKASSFYKEGKYDCFEKMLQNAITRGSKSYVDYKNELVRTHLILAAYYVRQAQCDPGHRRAEWQEKVSTVLQAVDKLQVTPSEKLQLQSRGIALMLLNLHLPEADNCFVAVLRQEPTDVIALLGRGCLAYNRQEYRVALGYFKNILLYYPQGPLDVRVGIAHCFLKLDDLDSARRAFELALANNGRCLNALLGMAQLKLNERTRPANEEAMNLLSAAYELNQRHPLVLSWLANHLYYSRHYETLQVVAGNAYVATDNEQLKAQNCFQIARSFHAQQNFKQAFAFYGKAVAHSPTEYPPPYLGLAQMYVRRGQLDKAENSLRALLKLLPEQLQALRMLATLYAQADVESKLDMAIHLFKKALSEDDFDTWLGLARTYERKQLWQEALDSYDQAVRIYQRLHNTTQDVPLTWLNNVAALQMHAGRPKEALKSLDKALSMTPDATQEHYESNLLTLRFNRARVLEELHLVEQAENSYQQLIVEYPNYYDCYLRLGSMAYKCNQLQVAKEKFQAVLQIDSGNETANIYLGNYHVRQGDLEQAMLNYNVVMNRNNEVEDSYMLVAVGNVGLINLQRSIDEGDHEMTKHQVQNSLQLFRKVLEQNQRNLWAANGIGVALSCNGYFSDADTIFKQITESPKRCPEAILNSAHVALELEHYSDAIEIYKKYLKMFPAANCVEVMQLLARSLFQAGCTKEAKEWLQKARHMAPYDLYLLYNLAIVVKQEGSDAFGKNGSNLEELQRAEGDLKLAKSFFNFLGQKQESLHSSKSQADLCHQFLENAPAELKNFHILEDQKNQEKLKKSEQNRQEIFKSISIDPFIKPKSLHRETSSKSKRSDREISTKSKRSDREPSNKRKKSDRPRSTNPKMLTEELSTKPKKLEDESSIKKSDAESTTESTKLTEESHTKSTKLEEESSIKPNKSDSESSTKPKKSHRERSTQPKKSQRKLSTKAKKLDREPSTKPMKLVGEAASEPKKLQEESSTKPTKLEEESSTKPKKSHREHSTKPKSLDREPTSKPIKSDGDAATEPKTLDKESFAMPKKLAEESSTKPKKSHREYSTKPNKLDGEPSTKPTKLDSETSIKQKKVDRKPSTRPKKLDRELSTTPKQLDGESSTKPNKLEEVPSTNPQKLDEASSTKKKILKEQPSTQSDQLDKEQSTKPKKLDEVSSAQPEKLEEESSTKPMKLDEESSTKPKNLDEKASTIPTNEVESDVTEMTTVTIQNTENLDSKLSTKQEENNTSVTKEDTQNITKESSSKKKKKRKHKSKDKTKIENFTMFHFLADFLVQVN